jgi:predicted MFS family arabinose efflux permease
LSQTPPPPNSKHSRMNALLLLAAAGLVASIATNGSRMAVPLFAVHLSASPMTVGLILSSYAVIPAFVAIAIGRWVDRIGARLPMQIASAGLSVALLVPWLFPELWALAVSATMVGVFMVFIYVGSQQAAGALSDASSRTRVFTLLTVAQSLALLVSPPITGVLIDHMGYRTAFLALSIAAMGLTAMMVFGGKLLPVHTRRTAEAKKNLLELLRMPAVLGALIVASLGPVGWDLLFFFVPLHGAHLGLSASSIGLVFSCFSVSIIAIRLAVPWMAKRMNEWHMIAIALGTAAVIFVFYPLTGSAGSMMALAVVLGAGMGISQPVMLSIMYASSPPGRQAEVLGMRSTALNAVQIVSPLMLGAMTAGIGLAAAMWPFAVLLLGGAHFCVKRGRQPAGAPN